MLYGYEYSSMRMIKIVPITRIVSPIINSEHFIIDPPYLNKYLYFVFNVLVLEELDNLSFCGKCFYTPELGTGQCACR